MIFNAPDPFFSSDKYDLFMDFEEKINKVLPNDIGLLCWYKPKWLNKFSLSYIISLLAHHKCIIDNTHIAEEVHSIGIEADNIAALGFNV